MSLVGPDLDNKVFSTRSWDVELTVLPMCHDLEPNNFPSGSPTQLITT